MSGANPFRSQFEDPSVQNKDTKNQNSREKFTENCQNREKGNERPRNQNAPVLRKRGEEQGSMELSLHKSNARHLALMGHLSTTAIAIKHQGDILATAVRKQGEASTVRLEERMEDLELDLTERMAEKTGEGTAEVIYHIKDNATAAEKGAMQRCSSITTTITTKTNDIESSIGELTNQVTKSADTVKQQAKNIESRTIDKINATLKKAEAKADAMEKSLKDHVRDKFNASEEDASQRFKVIKSDMSKNLQIVTTKASEVENAIKKKVQVEAQGAETRAGNRQVNVMEQLIWNSKSIETQNQAIKELSTHLTRPKGCSPFWSSVDRYCNRSFNAITTGCHSQRMRQKTETSKFLEQSVSEKNGVVILYGRSNLSKNIAGKVKALFTQQNFTVPQPTAYHDEMPSFRNECQCPWIVVYAILQEDQSTKLLSEAIKRIEEYFSNPNVQDCSKLVIVQCKWLPGGDLMTSLRALKNTTAIVVQMRDYHVQVVEKAFATESSFGDVVEKLKMDAKVRPRSLFKDDKDIGRAAAIALTNIKSSAQISNEKRAPVMCRPSVTITNNFEQKQLVTNRVENDRVLPKVEEAIAKQDGQSIVMTWKQISIDRVSYWIQVYCNEERTEEPFATGESKFRIESPEPGSRYTFIVWAERDGVQSEHRTLSGNFIMVHLAGEEDSEIEMNGCRVKFSRGTFKKMTRVWMSVGSRYLTCPEEYFPITPFMDIDLESQLHQDATVQMRSCCFNLDKSKVNILHFENLAGMEWTSLAPQSCSKDGLIEFQCREFSPWLITTIKNYLFGPAEFIMNIYLYVTNNQFCFIIFKNSGNERNIVKVMMDCLGARLAEAYEQCLVRQGDRLTIKPWVEGEPKSPRFTPFLDDYVIIDSCLLKRDYSKVLFKLEETAIPDKDRSFCIRCNICLNDKKADKGERFMYPLKPLPSVPNPVQIINRNSATGMSVESGSGMVSLQDSSLKIDARTSSSSER